MGKLTQCPALDSAGTELSQAVKFPMPGMARKQKEGLLSPSLVLKGERSSRVKSSRSAGAICFLASPFLLLILAVDYMEAAKLLSNFDLRPTRLKLLQPSATAEPIT